MRAAASLRHAVELLTVLPTGRRQRVEGTGSPAATMLWAPVVAVGLWFVVAAVVFVTRAWLDADFGDFLPAAVGVALFAVLTRGLHLDGLADTVDGLASYRPPEQARAIMRTGGIGALGAAALILVLLLQVAALNTAIDAHHGTVTLFVAAVTSRLAMTVSCVRGIPAAPDSTLGAGVVGTVGRAAAALTWLWVTAACVLAAQLDVHTPDRGIETLEAGCTPALVLVITWLFRRHATRRLGGVSGDVLGAQAELAALIAMIVMAGSP